MIIFAASTGVNILFSILAILCALGLIAFLYWSITKERKNWIAKMDEEKGIDHEKFEKKLESYITAKQEFTLYAIEIIEYAEMIRTLGDIQFESALGMFLKKIKRIFNANIKINIEGDRIYLISPSRVNKKEIEKQCNLIIYEAGIPVVLAGTLNIYFDISIGVASFPHSGKTMGAMMENLQIALVNSKRTGYNHFVIYDAQLSTTESEEFKTYLEIKEAIKDNEFTLYYHPIVALENKEVYAVETLLRWNHKSRGVLSPLVFLNLLEQSGDINWVGLWSFEQLIKQKEQWQKSYPDTSFSISINISQKQIRNANIAEELKKIMKRYHVQYSSVILEIIESAAFSREEIIINNINKLSQLGFKIAIDNYSADTTSLTKLEPLNLSMIKLDKRFFTSTMEDSVVTKGIFDILINFCMQKNVSLVCMGIETDEEIAFAQANNIHYAQGFLFTKPKNSKEVMQDILLTPWKVV